jgi:hypothetical protein
MKLYRLYLAKPLLVFYVVVLATWVGAGVVGIVVGAFGKFGPDGPPAWIFVIIIGFALLNAYMWLRFPFEIKVRDDNMVEFRSIFRRWSSGLTRSKQYERAGTHWDSWTLYTREGKFLS